eukprot:135032_1
MSLRLLDGLINAFSRQTGNKNPNLISHQEEQSINELNKYQDQITSLWNELNNSLTNVKQKSVIYQKEIQSKFKNLVINIQNKEKDIINEIKFIENEQTKKIILIRAI